MMKKRLVEVNAVLEKLCEYCICGCYEECDYRCIEFDNISNIPAVDAVEVMHGRWLKTCIPDIYHCTNCKRATKMDELCDSEILRAYCPNCGAKMDGRKDDGLLFADMEEIIDATD